MNLKGILNRKFIGVPLGVAAIILFSRLYILGAMAVGFNIVPKPNLDSWMTESGIPAIYHLANFDGAWYIRIAAIGYKKLESGQYDLAAEKQRLKVLDPRGYSEGMQGFAYRQFPFFPLLIRIAQKVFRNWVLSGLILSNLFSIIGLCYLYKLAEIEVGGKAGWWAVAFGALWPAAHYQVGLYSEGLMLAGMVGTVYHARRNEWVKALIVGALGAAVRIEGAVIFAALFPLLMEQAGGLKNALTDKRLLAAIGVPAGFLIPLLIFFMQTGTPIPFYSTTREALGMVVMLPWQSLAVDLRSPTILVFAVDVPFLLIMVLLGVLSVRRLSIPLASATIAGLICRLLQPHIAMLRFSMVFFPFYLYLGCVAERKPVLGAILLIMSALLLAVFSSLFVSGYWVA